MSRRWLWAGLAFCGPLAGCDDPAVSAEPLIYGERWRPQVHYSAPYGWMNDPNGMVHVDGTWHLFHQFNPLGDGFGFLSWGHATSPDLVRWRPTNVAIPFEGRTGIFSGSAVVDDANTSGLCDAKITDACVVAIYTANLVFDGGNLQHQNLAVSRNGGQDFVRFDGNPVLDIGSPEFRDPKVFWHAPTDRWIQVVVLPIERKVAIFGSPDLRDWQPLSEFGPAGAQEGIWECPDLFPLSVPGSAGQQRWVMKVDLNPGHVAGGSGGQYFVGDFDGERFVADRPNEVRWLDLGPDFYCATTWSNPPDDRTRWIGWMSNWRYAGDVPTEPWRGQMTLPREVTLKRQGDELMLAQKPVGGLAKLRGEPIESRGSADRVTRALEDGLAEADTWELELDAARDADFALRFTQTVDGPYAVLRYYSATRAFELERSAEANADVNPSFPGNFRAEVQDAGATLSLRVIVDRSSIELFADQGTVPLTALVLPKGTPSGVEVVGDGTFDVRGWPLASTWRAD